MFLKAQFIQNAAPQSYPAEGYGIKYEGSLLGEKKESGCFQNCFHCFFVSTTFGHTLHRIEPNICGCDLSMV